jgi:hypothetical protein
MLLLFCGEGVEGYLYIFENEEARGERSLLRWRGVGEIRLLQLLQIENQELI